MGNELGNELISIFSLLGLACALLGCFLAVQGVEYSALAAEGHVPKAAVRWAAFYTLTLCHGLHVLVGLLWAATLLVRVCLKGVAGGGSAPLEYGVLYLHFVDAVWVLLFVLLYVWPS